MASRNCAYCGKELTDAASMEAGIGPICRKLENRLLALTIPADVTLAATVCKRVSFSDLPEECEKTFNLVLTALETGSTEDWRETVKRVEWLLSHPTSEKVHNLLISVIDALGYVGLASLLHGEAAKGTATVTFENGKLFLKAPRKKAGRLALKEIKGRWFYPEDKRWSVPAAAHEEFKMVVWKHWPNHEGLEEAVKAAVYHETYKAEEAEATPVEDTEPQVKVTKDGSVLKIASPYNKAFINALKSEISAWKERRWNPGEKVWEVNVSHLDVVKTLVAKHYGESVPL